MSSLKIFVTGASGLVGSRFVDLYKDKYDLITPEYPAFDLTNKKQVEELINKNKPDVVINFAAYTNVSEAENQRDDKNGDCWKINVEGVKNLLGAIPKSTRFIQISTDMVFTGSKDNPGPYSEEQRSETKSDKVTWYGFTKGEAERIVLGENSPRTAILRIIYPFSDKYDLKLDYVRKPLSLFDQGKLYPMFSDQKVSTVYVNDVAKTLEKIIESGASGVFHASSSDLTTPFDLANYVIEKSRGVEDAVKPSSIDEFVKSAGNPVRYPKYGGLSVEKTEKLLNIHFPSWREMIDESGI